MTRIVCTDFDAFVEALPDLNGSYVLRTRQTRDWRLRTLDLDGVTLATGREGAGRIYNGVGLDGYHHLFLRLDKVGEVVVDGQALGREHVAWVVPGRMFHTRSELPTRWLNISISVAHTLDWALAHEDEFDFTLMRDSLMRRPALSPAPLLSLARRLFRVDAQSPEWLDSPQSKASARAQVLDTAFRTLLPARPANNSPRSGGDHMRILRQALGVLEAMETTVIHAQDLCDATGASERTVRNVFNDYLGMSPHRYLMVHRLHAIRAAIKHAGPNETLTRICSRYGVWDFGRFSRHYREHFGVSPSQMLRSSIRPARNGARGAW